MTPAQIIKLRTLLTEIQDNDLPRIHTAYAGGPDRVDMKIANARWDCSQKIRQALTLLHCPTCNDTKWILGRGDYIHNSGDVPNRSLKIPCPDCQSLG